MSRWPGIQYYLLETTLFKTGSKNNSSQHPRVKMSSVFKGNYKYNYLGPLTRAHLPSCLCSIQTQWERREIDP